MIYITLLTVLILIIVGIYNGWIFKLYFTKGTLRVNRIEENKRANKLVHSIGFWLRGLICLIPILTGVILHVNWLDILFYVLICFNFAWTGYDLTYNLIHKLKWNYSGYDKTSSQIDKFFGRADEFIKIALLISTIIIGIL